MALHNYHDAHGGFYGGPFTWQPRQGLAAIYVSLLPFLDETALYNASTSIIGHWMPETQPCR